MKKTYISIMTSMFLTVSACANDDELARLLADEAAYSGEKLISLRENAKSCALEAMAGIKDKFNKETRKHFTERLDPLLKWDFYIAESEFEDPNAPLIPLVAFLSDDLEGEDLQLGVKWYVGGMYFLQTETVARYGEASFGYGAHFLLKAMLYENEHAKSLFTGFDLPYSKEEMDESPESLKEKLIEKLKPMFQEEGDAGEESTLAEEEASALRAAIAAAYEYKEDNSERC